MVDAKDRRVSVIETDVDTPRSLSSRSPSRSPVIVGLWIIIAVSAVLWMIPIVFMIFTAFKSEREIFEGNAYMPPRDIEFGNLTAAWTRGRLSQSLKNSLIISSIKVPLGLLVSSLAAFALTRIRFRFRRVLLGVIALGALVPIQVALAPLFTIMLELDLLNSRLGIILPNLAFGIPYQVFILSGFFGQIPQDLDEAARIDGASNWRVYSRIIVPLAKPALGALFILDFVATWNEYAIASVLLQNQDVWTVPLSIQGFSTQFTSFYGPMNSFIMVSILPVMIVYLAFQRYFVSGAFTGAVKG